MKVKFFYLKETMRILKKKFVLDIKVIENDKFKKWNIINQKIINEKSSPNLLYLTSQIIS